MFQIFFVIICLFLVLCQYVTSTSDSNGVIEREHIHDDDIHSDVTKRTMDNVVLHYYPTPDEKEHINVVYHTKAPDNHYVLGGVFWYQTISIKESELNTFAECFSRHISVCRQACPSKRESVNISHYSFCKGACQMYSFEQQFLYNGILGYRSSDDLLANGQEIISNRFFKGEKHARKTRWEDFFSVIRNKFKNPSNGQTIYSEGKYVNHDFTYLYLLTNRFMYELGYNLKNESLFLMRIDLMVLALHCKIGSDFLKKNKYYSFEMPFDMIFDSQKEWKQENNLQYKNVGNIKKSNQQYSVNGTKRNHMSQNDTSKKVKSRKKNMGNNFYNLNRGKKKPGIGAIGRSLKNSETQNGFVINKRTEFEEKLWEDIKSVYNVENHKVDFDYYKKEMPLQ